MYKINQNEMDSSFRIPSSIVDKHIRLANEHQLKVLLWIMRSSPDNPDNDEMCRALKMKKDDALDYLQYWVLTGVLLCDGKDEAPAVKTEKTAAAKKDSAPAEKKEAEKETAVKPAPPAKEYSKPSISEIAARIEESPEVSFMFREAQTKLGKTIGYDMQCVLLMMHDYDGLPVEVIFMLIDYCVSIGKTNNNYIATVGRNWGEDEIDTIEKADERINALRNADTLWKSLADLAGIQNPRPTANQTAFLTKWGKTLGFGADMIYLAYEEMADHTSKMSFPYMDKVLVNWYESGIKTPKQLEEQKKAASDARKDKEKEKAKTKSPDTAKEKSYDIDEVERRAMNNDIRYERKKKK
jgi:DnaD/phage-associated family protein